MMERTGIIRELGKDETCSADILECIVKKVNETVKQKDTKMYEAPERTGDRTGYFLGIKQVKYKEYEVELSEFKQLEGEKYNILPKKIIFIKDLAEPVNIKKGDTLRFKIDRYVSCFDKDLNFDKKLRALESLEQSMRNPFTSKAEERKKTYFYIRDFKEVEINPEIILK